MSTTERITQIMTERGIKQSFVEGLLGTYRGKITEWKKGKSSPTMKELEILADFFDVPLAYLTGKGSQTSLEHKHSSKVAKLIARLNTDLPQEDAQEFFKIIDENFEKFIAAKKQAAGVNLLDDNPKV